jgi:flagellar hook-associated protein 2
MNAHRIPLNRLMQQRQLLEWQKEAYREVNRLMVNFRKAVEPLRFQGTFLAKKANVSDTTLANVTASNNAVEGTYTLNVTQLAKGASVTSEKLGYSSLNDYLYVHDPNNPDNPDPNNKLVAPNEIHINGIKVDLRPYKTADGYLSVGQFVAAVNAYSADTGVKVSYDITTQRFYFITTKTGKDAVIDFTVDVTKLDDPAIKDDIEAFLKQAFLIEPNTKKTGENAKIDFQGVTGLEFNTNTININGLSIQLKNTGETIITVSRDTDAIYNTIKTFIDEYNKLVDEVNKKLQEPRYRDYPPLTKEQKEQMKEKEIELWEEKAKSGMIRNDSLISGFMAQLRLIAYSTVEPVDSSKWSNGVTNSALKHLAALGIETGSYVDENGKLVYGERGKLYIKDEAKLRQAISENPDDVMMLFTARPNPIDPDQTGTAIDQEHLGLGHRLYNQVNLAISQLSEKAGSVNSLMLVDNSTLGERIKDIDERIARMQDRLVMIEQRYWSQFTAMERALARMNMQSAWLAQTFGGGGQQS